jgi:hypothetical protein
MKYFLIFWLVIGSPFIFPYIAMQEGWRGRRHTTSYFLYGGIALITTSIYLTLIMITLR